MLIFFLDVAGIIHREFVPERTTVNSRYYLGVLERLYARMRHVKKRAVPKPQVLLLHENCPFTASWMC
jgi:Transposase.